MKYIKEEINIHNISYTYVCNNSSSDLIRPACMNHKDYYYVKLEKKSYYVLDLFKYDYSLRKFINYSFVDDNIKNINRIKTMVLDGGISPQEAFEYSML